MSFTLYKHGISEMPSIFYDWSTRSTKRALAAYCFCEIKESKRKPTYAMRHFEVATRKTEFNYLFHDPDLSFTVSKKESERSGGAKNLMFIHLIYRRSCFFYSMIK